MDRYAGFPAVWWGLLGLLIGWVTMWVMDVVFWRRVPPDRELPAARPQEVEALLRAKAHISSLEAQLAKGLPVPPSEDPAPLRAELEQAQVRIADLESKVREFDGGGGLEPLRRQVRLLEADKRTLTEQVSRASEVIRDLEAKVYAAEQAGLGR